MLLFSFLFGLCVFVVALVCFFAGFVCTVRLAAAINAETRQLPPRPELREPPPMMSIPNRPLPLASDTVRLSNNARLRNLRRQRLELLLAAGLAALALNNTALTLSR